MLNRNLVIAFILGGYFLTRAILGGGDRQYTQPARRHPQKVQPNQLNEDAEEGQKAAETLNIKASSFTGARPEESPTAAPRRGIRV
jgi:hypothetical protein